MAHGPQVKKIEVLDTWQISGRGTVLGIKKTDWDTIKIGDLIQSSLDNVIYKVKGVEGQSGMGLGKAKATALLVTVYDPDKDKPKFMSYRTECEEHVLLAARRYARIKCHGAIIENGQFTIFSSSDVDDHTKYLADQLLIGVVKLLRSMATDEKDGKLIE